MIKVHNLTKTYKMGKENVVALKDINLSIKEGEFVAIVGPSGSGKSTLMNIIGGIDTPLTGSIIIDGEDISKFKEKKLSEFRNKKIGFIFQSFNLDASLTALENVMLPLMFGSVELKKRKIMAQDMLNKVGLQDRLKHKPTELSGGQKQRVSIARALINTPKIILADEPTGNLDSKTGASIMELLKSLNANGYTIVLITHNMEEAKNANRIIEIRDGEILEVAK